MIVRLVAHTVITDWVAMQAAGWVNYPHVHAWEENGDDADILAEFAGRNCYQSWSRPNPGTATNESYLRNILDVDHSSVLEHASATFYAEGISRTLTHELVRHRHLSFSQLSQRFVRPGPDGQRYVVPPALAEVLPEDPTTAAVISEVEEASLRAYAQIVGILEHRGLRPKEAREAARSVLLGGVETKLVVTGNMRAWRYVLQKRLAPQADAEIREFAQHVLRQLKEIAPNTFQDLS